MSFDSVFHGAPTSSNGQSVPSGIASLGIDVTAGQLYYRTPTSAGWLGVVPDNAGLTVAAGVLTHGSNGGPGTGLAAGSYIFRFALSDGNGNFSNLVDYPVNVPISLDGTDWWEVDWYGIGVLGDINSNPLMGEGWVSFNGGPFRHLQDAQGDAYVIGIYVDANTIYDSVPVPTSGVGNIQTFSVGSVVNALGGSSTILNIAPTPTMQGWSLFSSGFQGDTFTINPVPPIGGSVDGGGIFLLPKDTGAAILLEGSDALRRLLINVEDAVNNNTVKISGAGPQGADIDVHGLMGTGCLAVGGRYTAGDTSTTNDDCIVYSDATTATVTLDETASVRGNLYTVCNVGTGTITVAARGGSGFVFGLAGGPTSVALATGESITVTRVSDGDGHNIWGILSFYKPGIL